MWRNTDPEDIDTWLMNPFGKIDNVTLPSGANLAWVIREVCDVNGDETNDLAWRHTTSGKVVIWLMNTSHDIEEVTQPGNGSGPWEHQPPPPLDGFTCGNLETGSIDAASEADPYTFIGTAGDRAALTITGGDRDRGLCTLRLVGPKLV